MTIADKVERDVLPLEYRVALTIMESQGKELLLQEWNVARQQLDFDLRDVSAPEDRPWLHYTLFINDEGNVARKRRGEVATLGFPIRAVTPEEKQIVRAERKRRVKPAPVTASGGSDPLVRDLWARRARTMEKLRLAEAEFVTEPDPVNAAALHSLRAKLDGFEKRIVLLTDALEDE